MAEIDDLRRGNLYQLQEKILLVETLRAELDAAKVDAERYRWIRSTRMLNGIDNDSALTHAAWEALSGVEDTKLDAAIDAAIDAARIPTIEEIIGILKDV